MTDTERLAGMTPEVREYFRSMIGKVAAGLGEDEALRVFAEVQRRMGPGGTVREWRETTVAVLRDLAAALTIVEP